MVGIGAAHHAALLHRRVAADDVFDHGGEHLEAVVPDDDALDAGIQIHKAVLVHIADIAGVRPQLAVGVAAQQVGGLLGLVVVALHGGGGADADLAALTDGQLGLGARLENGDHRVDHGDAHAAGLCHVTGGNGSCRGYLGHAVALCQRELHPVGFEELVHRLLRAQREGVAAGGVVADEGEVFVFQQRVGGQLLVVGGHAEHVRGLVLPHQRAQLIRVQIGDDDDVQPHDQRHVDAAAVTVGDEGRHHVQHLLPAVEQAALGGKLLRKGVEAVVGQHNALGRAGSAAGVHHHAGVLGVVGHGGGAVPLARINKVLPAQHVGGVAVFIRVGQLVAHGFGQRQAVGGAEHHHPLHAGALCGLMAAGVHHVQADEQAGLHLLDVLPDALGAVPGVHQIQGSAQQVGGVEGVDHLRGHHADHRDDIALFHPQRLQGGGGLFDLHDQVGIAELASVVFQRGVAQMPLIVAADQLKGRALRHGLVDVLFLIILQPRLCLGGIDRLLGGFRHRIKTFLHFFLLFSFQVCCPAQRLRQTKKAACHSGKLPGCCCIREGKTSHSVL